jgi:bifunctional DNase/RNase
VTDPEQTPSDLPDAGLATAEPPAAVVAAAPVAVAVEGSPGPDGPSTPDPAPGAVPTPSVAAVDFRMALVSSVTLDLPSQHPSVVLREIDTPRRQVTFSIGLSDAVALSHAQRRIPTPRPLTHELLSGVLQRFDIDVVAVRLVGRQGGIYFAELDLRGRTGRSVLSCRPSDALTLALHQPVQVPILVDARLLEHDGDVAPAG